MTATQGVPSATLLNEAKQPIAQGAVASVDVIREVNRIPRAVITLLDGKSEAAGFKLSHKDAFKPGAVLSVKLGSARSKPAVVFKGMVVRHRIEASMNKGSLLTLELKDEAVKLTTTRKNAIFQDKTDSDILKKVLSADQVPTLSLQHRQMIQYYSTDWDFALSRAEANGLWILAKDGSIQVKKPTVGARGKHLFKWGDQIIFDVEMEADLNHQIGSAKAVGWDVKKQQATDPQDGQLFQLRQGAETEDLAKALDAKPEFYHAVGASAEEMKYWAGANLMRSRLALYKGRLRVPGMSDYAPGDAIEFKGFSKRFNGVTLVTAVRHQFSRGRAWTTDLQFGLEPEHNERRRERTDLPAAGLVPAVNGLQVGQVAKFKGDPDNFFRVRVKLPAMGGIVWARLASIYASEERGVFFRPEVGDEVIVGFLNDDPREAVILGSVHNPKRKPPFKVTSKNHEKGLVVGKGKMKFFFHGENKTAILKVSDKTLLTMKDQKHAVLKTSDQESLSLKDGFAVKTPKAAEIKADQKITLQAKMDCEIKSSTKVAVDGGPMVDIKGGAVDVN